MKQRHPIQPVIVDECGVHRFKENKIIRCLLETGPLDLNQLAMMDFSREDREQVAQLIGYSVSGFGDLSYASRRVIKKADRRSERLAAKSKDAQ